MTRRAGFIETLAYVRDHYAIKDAGSFYDRLTLLSWYGGATPHSGVMLVMLRRRQDHAHPKPWDTKVVIATQHPHVEPKYEIIGVPD